MDFNNIEEWIDAMTLDQLKPSDSSLSLNQTIQQPIPFIANDKNPFQFQFSNSASSSSLSLPSHVQTFSILNSAPISNQNNPFFLYRDDKMPLLKIKYPNVTSRQLMTIMGQMWRQERPEVKNYYLKKTIKKKNPLKKSSKKRKTKSQESLESEKKQDGSQSSHSLSASQSSESLNSLSSSNSSFHLNQFFGLEENQTKKPRLLLPKLDSNSIHNQTSVDFGTISVDQAVDTLFPGLDMNDLKFKSEYDEFF